MNDSDGTAGAAGAAVVAGLFPKLNLSIQSLPSLKLLLVLTSWLQIVGQYYHLTENLKRQSRL